jgi:branched-chain amino acid transport system permease protein
LAHVGRSGADDAAGWLGTILGPAVGSATIVTLQNELADKVGSWVTVIMGVIFVVCVLAFRRGIVGEIQALIQRAGIR